MVYRNPMQFEFSKQNILFFLLIIFLSSCSVKKSTKPKLPDALKDYSFTSIDINSDSGKYDKSFLLQKVGEQKKIIWIDRYSGKDQKDSIIQNITYYTNEAVIKLKPSIRLENFILFLQQVKQNSGFDISVKDSLKGMHTYLVEFKSSQVLTFPELKKAFDGFQDTEYIEPNYVVYQQSNQFLVDYDVRQWSLFNEGIPSLNGGKYDADGDGIEAMSRIKYSRLPKYPVLISVIDNGIDITHPALAPVLWLNTGEIPNNNVDDDNNGFIDDLNGWNFAGNNKIIQGTNNHGTHVSGIIAAKPTQVNKMSGICPEAKILTAKYAEGMTGSLFATSQAVNYSVQMRAQIINLSNRSLTSATYFYDAIKNAIDAGVIVVAAAGNDAWDLYITPVYPACYPRVICVASTTSYDQLAPTSNFQYQNQFNTPFVRISAPGDAIYSTFIGGGYGLLGGTSMASPFVAGSIGLIKSIYPTEDLISINRRLLGGADILEHLNNKVIEGKRINIYKSLFQPFETLDANGTPYRDQIVEGEGSRGLRYPYANSRDEGVDGLSYVKAFKIASMKQLINIRDEDLSKHFRLMNNISWQELEPVYRNMINKRFMGVLYGDGFTIHNFNLVSTGGAALFAEIGNTGRVINLKFSGVNIKGNFPVGTVALKIRGGILNDVQVEGVIKGVRSVGGICGIAEGATLINCFFGGEVISEDPSNNPNGKGTGGLAGQALQNTTIENCHIQGKISGNSAGGVVGRMFLSKIIQTYANVYIEGKDSLGGLIGSLRRSTMENCYVEGMVQGTGEIAGGAVGFVSQNIIKNIYSKVKTVSTTRKGGALIGYGRDFSIRQSFFLAGSGPPGAGGISKTPAELKNPATFTGWFNGANRWVIPSGYTPAIPTLPRSVTSLYKNDSK
ncbi:MAG: S8 family serine peptidase [Chitinophagaceae bacterium]|nr:S8 family serine peptidase [Chitinophagaceae bacterium]